MIRVIVILTIYFMTTPSQAQNQDPWSVYMTPADVHTLFSKYTGNFKMEMTVGIGSSQPTVFTMDSHHQMLLGGRFLEMKQQGDMMGVDYQCEDCAIEESRVEKSGGKIHQSKMAIGEFGFCSMCIDTEGNMFGLHSMK
ncbi:MAG: DUF1579 family protein [Flavobacteriaceae bacterium]